MGGQLKNIFNHLGFYLVNSISIWNPFLNKVKYNLSSSFLKREGMLRRVELLNRERM